MSLWTPLESNPDVLNKYIYKLGVSDKWAITDVFGLEPEMLDWIPQPIKAIILLFPITETMEKHRAEENEIMASKPQEHPKDLFYMRQITHNACGTVALIHSVANNPDIELSDGVLKEFLKRVKDMTPDERAVALENDMDITSDHQALAEEGQTEADPLSVYHHFIAFINKDNILYELDGRKNFPIPHGLTSPETFAKDAAKICKQFIARDPNEVRFNVLALAAATQSA